MANAVAEAEEEVDDGLDARQEHDHRAQHAPGHRHDRHWLHGLALLSDPISLQRRMEGNLHLRQSRRGIKQLLTLSWQTESSTGGADLCKRSRDVPR